MGCGVYGRLGNNHRRGTQNSNEVQVPSTCHLNLGVCIIWEFITCFIPNQQAGLRVWRSMRLPADST